MKKRSTVLFSFFLFALMLFKVSSFHVYSHQDSTSDDIENCAVCELAIENQNTDYLFVTTEIVTTPIADLGIQAELTSYEAVITSSFLRASFFGRPPPAVV